MKHSRSVTWMDLLSFQASVVSNRQARAQGMSRHAIARRLRSGDWQRLHYGTYAAFSGTPSREAMLWAAVVRVGPSAVLSHDTAAEIHRLTDKPSSKIHVTVPASRNPARSHNIPGIVVHRSRDIASEQLPPWQLPRTPLAETVLDLADAARTFDDAYGWLTRAIGRQLVSVPQLRAALGARSRIRWRGLLTEALAEVQDGVMSPLERRYVRDVEHAHGLPAARRQVRRELAGGIRFLDNYYAQFGCASNSTAGRATRRSRSGRMPAGTTTTCSATTWRPCASACSTSPLTAAPRRPGSRPCSCAAAGTEPACAPVARSVRSAGCCRIIVCS